MKITKDFALKELNTVKNLLDTGILDDINHPCVEFRSPVFTETVIRLNDILQLLSQHDRRIIYAQDVIQSEDIKDVTDLVNRLRNAACHLNSGNREVSDLENIRILFSFNLVGPKTKLPLVKGFLLENNYADDLAYYYGRDRIYLKRHLYKLVQDLIPNKLKSLEKSNET
jgi:hypothetical protein